MPPAQAELPAASLRVINAMYRMVAPRYRVSGAYWHTFELARASAAHWPRRGRNVVRVDCDARDPGLSRSVGAQLGAQVPVELELRDVELDLQYLLGRSFHRGEDPALGPSVYTDMKPRL
jgi:hypothetical protein